MGAKKFGSKLYCVRYRYDDDLKRKAITVELIVEESQKEERTGKLPLNKRMPVKVGYSETSVRKLIKTVGGRWNPQKRVWELPYREILNLGLQDRIVGN